MHQSEIFDSFNNNANFNELDWINELDNDVPLSSIPIKYRSYTVCLQAVMLDGENFEFVPLKHQTVELCNIAIENDSYAFTKIDASRFTMTEMIQFYKLAYNRDRDVVNVIPQKYLQYLFLQ